MDLEECITFTLESYKENEEKVYYVFVNAILQSKSNVQKENIHIGLTHMTLLYEVIHYHTSWQKKDCRKLLHLNKWVVLYVLKEKLIQ